MVPVKTANMIQYLCYKTYVCSGPSEILQYYPCNESSINSFTVGGLPQCFIW